MIHVKDVSVSYGGERVLRHCSLHVEKGSRVALMGPSGCGKTTLVHAVAGLIRPESGCVSVNGTVSYVFQEPALFPWLDALENINVVLRDDSSTRGEAEVWLRAVGLAECRGKYPHQLSGGQKQRVAICRALAYGGDVLLLDEPLKGLDPDTREQVAQVIERASRGKTVLLVTHDRWEAERLCERVYTYADGRFEG